MSGWMWLNLPVRVINSACKDCEALNVRTRMEISFDEKGNASTAGIMECKNLRKCMRAQKIIERLQKGGKEDGHGR